MSILTCKACPTTAEYNPMDTGGNIKALMEKTGFEPLMNNDTSMSWWCPTCLDKALPHIEALMVLLGDEGHPRKPGITYWNCLPRMVTRLRVQYAEHQKESEQ